MSQNELSMLGYEDLVEFKSYYNDFAELFVEHPGYISNFKNFSWIDYALHSGAPNKNVILKHKNGTEVEAELIITEILLMNPINDTSIAYCVEIHTLVTSSKSEFLNIQNDIEKPLPVDTDDNSKILHIEEKEENSLDNFDDMLKENEAKESMRQIFETESVIEDEIEINNDISKEDFSIQSLESDIISEKEEFIIDSISEQNEPEIEEQIKLKVTFDDDLLESDKQPAPYIAQEETIEISEHVSIKKEEDFSDLTEDKEDSHQNIHEENFEEIDFTQIAEDTGIDLSDIAEFIGDFIDESENYIKNLHDSENSSNYSFIRNEAIKLKGVASNLKMGKITKTLNTIIESKDGDKFDTILELFQKQIKNLEEQLS